MESCRDVFAACLMASMLVVGAACTNYDAGSSGCSADRECRGDRICVEGGCVFPPDELPSDTSVTDSGATDSGFTDGGEEDPPPDTGEEDPDVVVDGGGIEPPDIWESDPDTNTDPPPPPPRDGGIIIPEPDADVGTPDGVVRDRR